MSNITKAVILQSKFYDKECIIETLRRMNIKFIEQGKIIMIPDLNFRLVMEKDAFTVVYDNLYAEQVKQFISRFMYIYRKTFEEKLERIRLEELKIQEEKILAEVARQKELEQRMLELRKKRMRLEKIKKKEEIERKREIANKVKEIIENAKKYGYEIKVEEKENERVIVLVRRR